jgi:hypothetical protein
MAIVFPWAADRLRPHDGDGQGDLSMMKAFKFALVFIPSLFFAGFVAFIPIRLAVTLVGNIVGWARGEQLPLGAPWVNWLCYGLGLLAIAIRVCTGWTELAHQIAALDAPKDHQ